MSFKMSTVTATGFSVSADFTHTMCILENTSGAGKTYLFSLIKTYCHAHDLPVELVDYEPDMEKLARKVQACAPGTVILFDNSELYLDWGIITYFYRGDCTLIVSTHNGFSYPCNLNVGHYTVEFTKDYLVVREG